MGVAENTQQIMNLNLDLETYQEIRLLSAPITIIQITNTTDN